MPGKIFVNYRRDDARDMAARIRDRLAATFGDANVFMDVDNLLAGQRFDKELEKALGRDRRVPRGDRPALAGAARRAAGQRRARLRARGDRRGAAAGHRRHPGADRADAAATCRRAARGHPRPRPAPEARRSRTSSSGATLRGWSRPSGSRAATARAGCRRWRLGLVYGCGGSARRLLLLGSGVLAYQMGGADPAPAGDRGDAQQPGGACPRLPSDCPEMVVVPAGEFIMGSPDERVDRREAPAQGDHRAAVCRGQVRGDVRRVGRLCGSRRLQEHRARAMKVGAGVVGP